MQIANPQPPQPISPDGLAALIAGLARRSAFAAAPGPGVRPTIRVGIDAAVEQDGRDVADAVCAALAADAVPVARLHATDFLRPRSLRLEYGLDDPGTGYELWYDVPALRREALDRLGPGGDGSWLPKLRDRGTDRSVRVQRELAPPGTVAVLDGRFLLRPELGSALDLVIHLDVSPAARARRTPPDDELLTLGAWDRYLDECRSARSADVVVRFEHPRKPAVLRQPV